MVRLRRESLLGGEGVPPRAPPPRRVQASRPKPARFITAYCDAAASTVVLGQALRERLTRTSACALASAENVVRRADRETVAKSPDNAEIYAETYGKREAIEQLAPTMIETFLMSDAGFKRARKQLQQKQKEK